ncbi:MAG: glycoside hydrolase family 2 TIM barrel-domain containing protein [Cyclobacteriaceae bacterium]
MNRIYLVYQALVLFAVVAVGQNHQRTIFNDGWQYLEEPVQDVEKVLNTEGWEYVDLPHTWNDEDVMDQRPGYRRNQSWYSKTLTLSAKEEGVRHFLYFEGSNITTRVYVNQKLVKDHIGGYLGFRAELTNELNVGDNQILVSVDNGYDRQVIPSQKSDFFIYGGIVRDVWLEKSGSLFIDQVQITTPQVSNQSAKATVRIIFDGQSKKGQKVSLNVRDPSGKLVNEKSIVIKGDELEYSFKLNRPMLWDISNPNLYTLEASIEGSDKVTEKYGYRWFEFKENGPFYLNGKRLLLRGTHRHEESAGVGAALSNEMHRRDMEMIKEMGANFVRLGHYPQDPEIYKACNELGILVWDELPWCRGGLGNDVWKDNTKRLLSEMINQNFNHPSIIIWSLGNEIYWLPDFEGGDDVEPINSFLSELNDMAHALDPSRKTAIRKYYEGSDIVDVFSPSIWSGWYAGTYDGYKNALDNSLKKYRHFLHMEYGGSSLTGRHKENPISGDGKIVANDFEEPINQYATQSIANIGDWSENYIVDLFDWTLKVAETHPDFAGSAQWAFKDFGTPLRPENDIPYLNQKGLVTRDGKPKDAYYVFKSYWAEDPFAYIESHTWTERSGPEGLARSLNVYSNCEEVRLIANGQDLGLKKKDINSFPASGLVWNYSFNEGLNKLVAIGFIDNNQVTVDSLALNYSFRKSEKPKEILLSSETLPNGHLLITATMVDTKGQRCLDYEERVYFQCLEGGELNINTGTNNGSEVINMANGKAMIELIPDAKADKIVMSVLNQNFKGTYLEVSIPKK